MIGVPLQFADLGELHTVECCEIAVADDGDWMVMPDRLSALDWV